jgi:oxygen-dependent protoporphyrinogen oxidase
MRTAVVGGGLSGLAVAHALRARGEQVLVLEAEPRVGGVIRSTLEDGFLTESGPNSILDREPATRALVRELGLSGQVRPASPAAKRRFVYTRGALRALPGSPPAFLTSDLLPLASRLRVLGELFSARAPAGADESLADFGRRHLGREATASLVDALQTGTFAGDPERLSVAAAFPELARLEREHRSLLLGMVRAGRARRQAAAGGEAPSGAVLSFEGGLETLVRALERALGEAVHRSVPVRELSPRAGGWRLATVREGRPESLEVDRVVLATPAWAAAELVRPLDGTLAGELTGIPYAAIAVVHLGYARAEAGAVPEGFGLLVPEREGRSLLGCIFASSPFPFRAPRDGLLLTCLVGGARHPERVAWEDAALVAAVREELRVVLGLAAAPRLIRVHRWARGIPQYEVGHLARLERLEARLAALPGLFLAGNAYRGVGVNDCLRNAALLAGRLVSG